MDSEMSASASFRLKRLDMSSLVIMKIEPASSEESQGQRDCVKDNKNVKPKCLKTS